MRSPRAVADAPAAAIKRCHNDIGGIGNFIMMGQGGDLTHQQTPVLQDLKEPEDAAFDANERVRERAAG